MLTGEPTGNPVLNLFIYPYAFKDHVSGKGGKMKLPKTAKRIQNSKDYIDLDGTVYTNISNYKNRMSQKVIKKAQHTVHGYKYCGIYDTEKKKCVQRRVHRLVAEAYIPNPEKLPVVGHKNNIKTDNRVENLYWTTNRENIQKAVDDGLLANDIGFEDSQSKPVAMFRTTTNEKIRVFGSIFEAARQTGLPKTTIARQAKYHRPVRTEMYFRYLDDETAIPPELVGMFDFQTDGLVQVFINKGDAARKTGCNENTIGQQCSNGKPKHRFGDYYFGYVNSKCEQTIESGKRVE